MTTNILLTIIAVLLAVRIVLQVRYNKHAFDNMYCAPSEVATVVAVADNTERSIQGTLIRKSASGWEFVQALPYKDGQVLLFFTRKKIKNYYEE